MFQENSDSNVDSHWVSRFPQFVRLKFPHEVYIVFNALNFFELVSNYEKGLNINYIMNETAANKFKLVSSVINPNCLVKSSDLLLDDLFKDLEHWTCPDAKLDSEISLHWNAILFYLSSWLVGDVPPPRCGYAYFFENTNDVNNNITQCLQQSDEDCIYCSKFHRCQYTITGRCKECRSEGSNFCDIHKCKYKSTEGEICSLLRTELSEFCLEHACPGCFLINDLHGLNNNINLYEVKCKVGLYSCENHQCNFKNCQKLQLFPHLLCEDHVCDICLRLNIISNLPKIGKKYCSLHKCNYDGAKCDEVIHKDFGLVSIGIDKYANNEFCLKHSCVTCYVNNDNEMVNCVDKTVPNSKLCSSHRCTYPNDICLNEISGNSDFCLLHSCKICVRLELFCRDIIVDEVPRNVCSLHVLCTYISDDGTSCNNVAIENSLYCRSHQKSVCSGINKKKMPCKAQGQAFDGRLWYCLAHANQGNCKNTALKLINDDWDTFNDADITTVTELPALPAIELPSPINVHHCGWVSGENTPCHVKLALHGIDQDNWLCPVHYRYLHPSVNTTKAIDSLSQDLSEIVTVESILNAQKNTGRNIEQNYSKFNSKDSTKTVAKHETIVDNADKIDELIWNNVASGCVYKTDCLVF